MKDAQTDFLSLLPQTHQIREGEGIQSCRGVRTRPRLILSVGVTLSKRVLLSLRWCSADSAARVTLKSSSVQPWVCRGKTHAQLH